MNTIGCILYARINNMDEIILKLIDETMNLYKNKILLKNKVYIIKLDFIEN